MLVVFVNNQVLAAPNGTPVTVTTDPVALGENHVMTAVTNVHDIFGATPGQPGLGWYTEVSDDGQRWVAQGLAEGPLTATGASRIGAGDVFGVYVRVVATFTCDTGALGSVAFDVHANFTKS